jgi:hypothetical protein
MGGAEEQLFSLLELGISALMYLVFLHRMRLAEPASPPWWSGYARDAVNAVTLVLFTIGLRLFEFALPTALLSAFFFALFLFLLDGLLASRDRLRSRHLRYAVYSGIVLTALIAFYNTHRSAERAISRLIESTIPKHPSKT